jgi:hypothetical protein
MQKTEEDKSVNYVFCKSITITEIHDSSPHVCKNYFILLLVFNIFVFTNTRPIVHYTLDTRGILMRITTMGATQI